MAAADEPYRKLSAILSADAVGYSRLMQADEPATVETLKAYRTAMRLVIERHKGRVVNAPGDALLAEFPSVVEAVTAAVEIQRNLEGRNTELAPDRRMHFRIGVNLGDVIQQDDGAIYGDGVNIAARMEALAEAGGVCVSSTVFDAVEGKLAMGFDFLGEQQVKNISKPIRVYRVRTENAPPKQASPPTFLERLKLGPRRGQARAIVAGTLIVALIALGATLWQRTDGNAKPSTAPRTRLAVLPFTNISADPNDEYFADGMTEELISHLSKIHGLDVIARTSVMAYKDKGKKVDEIGRELNVGTVLEGSVRKAQDQVRITAQLIDVQTQAHLWAEDYDRELKSVLTIQSEIAKSVAAALKVRLAVSEREQIEKPKTEIPEAHELYLKGLYHWNKQSPEGMQKGIQYYEQAIQRDPSYAQAYAASALAHEIQGFYGLAPEKESFAAAKALALKASELDSTNVLALAVLADTAVLDWDWQRGEDLYQRSLALNPSSAYVHSTYGLQYLSAIGRHEEAITELRRAVELDPLSAQYLHDLGWALQVARRYDEAMDQFEKALQLEPTFSNVYRGLGEIYAYKGMHGKSIEAMQDLVKTSGETSYALASLGWAYGAAGKKEEAIKILDALKQKKGTPDEPSPSDFARVYLGLGDKERALDWLEKSYEERSGIWILIWSKQFPFFDGLRAEPRFKALLRNIKLA